MKTKVKVKFVGTEDNIDMIVEYSFEDFIKNLFSKKIYVSIPSDGSFPVAINTENISFVVKEYYGGDE